MPPAAPTATAGFQPDNLIRRPSGLRRTLISLGILALTRSSIFNMQFWLLWALALPAALLGTSTGLEAREKKVHRVGRIAKLLGLWSRACMAIAEWDSRALQRERLAQLISRISTARRKLTSLTVC